MNPNRSNEAWIADLRSPATREAALQDLRAWLKQNLPYGLNRYLTPAHPQFDTLLEETIQETLLRVLDKLETFRGNSRFTTWVSKIAIHIALSELRRKRWRDRSLDAMLEPAEDEVSASPAILQDTESISPEQQAVQQSVWRIIHRAIEEELSERQRRALQRLAFENAPMAIVAEEMHTNPNALYKLLHDARLKLKKRLLREGLSIEEILVMFEK